MCVRRAYSMGGLLRGILNVEMQKLQLKSCNAMCQCVSVYMCWANLLHFQNSIRAKRDRHTGEFLRFAICVIGALVAYQMDVVFQLVLRFVAFNCNVLFVYATDHCSSKVAVSNAMVRRLISLCYILLLFSFCIPICQKDYHFPFKKQVMKAKSGIRSEREKNMEASERGEKGGRVKISVIL